MIILSKKVTAGINSLKSVEARGAAFRICQELETKRSMIPDLVYTVTTLDHTEYAGAVRTNLMSLDRKSENMGLANAPISYSLMNTGWFRVYYSDNNMYIGYGLDPEEAKRGVDRLSKVTIAKQRRLTP